MSGRRLARLVYVAMWILGSAGAVTADASAAPFDALVADALARSGDNRSELEGALAEVDPSRARGLRFLLAHMPDPDLRSLSTEFLLENVDLAYEAWHSAPWRDRVPEDVFLNEILPYAVVNERRDAWRAEMRDELRTRVADCRSPSEAAVRLNQTIFDLFDVRYSTEREKPDQSPSESMTSGMASCTGLSILLVDACRAVGVPARFAGTPLWADSSGNHSWVEIWDDGWHFTGAAEPAGDRLNEGWFTERARQARSDPPVHAIYATSFRKTGLSFPLVWADSLDFVPAVDVTTRYAAPEAHAKEGWTRVRWRVVDGRGDRVAAHLVVLGGADEVLFEGTSHDETHDANDHLTIDLPSGDSVRVHAGFGGTRYQEIFRPAGRDTTVTVRLR